MQPAPAAPDPAQPTLGTQVSHSSMVNVAPAKLADTKVRVLNASGQGGQAADVAGALRDLGFKQPTAANDPIYAGTRLTCQGQIRFGEAGQAAAAAVWLVAPCVELFQDDRTDDSVDLALGTEFTALAHSDDIDAVLAGLRPGATEPAGSIAAVARSMPTPADRRCSSKESGRPPKRSSRSSSSDAMPGAATSDQTGAVGRAPGSGSRTRAPASAAMSAPAAQSHGLRPCS